MKMKVLQKKGEKIGKIGKKGGINN